VINNPMSSSKAKAAKPATNPPLSLEDTLHDLAVIRSSNIDLAAILASAMPTGTGTGRTAITTAADVDASVTRSHEFAQAARAAIKIKNRGDVEAQGERVNEVRGQLEEVVEGFVGGS
jgi:predicted RNA methylase